MGIGKENLIAIINFRDVYDSVKYIPLAKHIDYGGELWQVA